MRSKYVVVHVGTNNVGKDAPGQIANGIISIGLAFQEKIPEIKVNSLQ